MNRRTATGLLAIASCLSTARLDNSAQAEALEGQNIKVVVTNASCDPDALTASAGRATFSIYNATALPIEWEILDGVMVVDERENIPPGATRTLTPNLTPGDYQITCGLLSNPKGSLHVKALDGAAPKVALNDLIGPLAEYRFYASGEIDGLVDDTRRMADALKAGDLPAARGFYSSAHAHYARIAPLAFYFPDLDGVADPDAEREEAPDPSVMGFRQLAWQLSATGPHKFGPIADKLVGDVAAMQSRFEDLPLTPKPTFVGAVQALSGAAASKLGQAGAFSADDVAELQGYFEGVKKLVDLFQPLISKRAQDLSAALGGDFASASSTLEKFQTASGTSNTGAVADEAVLKGATKRLAEEVGRLPGVLGLD